MPPALAGTFYGLDVVREFQVVTGGGQAEFGRALGGYVNMVSKSGTNDFHGDLYGFFRNQRLNAANALTNTKLPLTQTQYGASVGGPIVKSRTFYFANFEQRELNQSGLMTIAPANVDIINARLVASGYGGSQISTGQYPNPVHNTNFLGKVDHQFNENDQFSVRYSLYDVNSRNSRGAGALSAVSAAAGLDDLDQTVAASNIWTISPRTVNETRGQFTYSNLNALAQRPDRPGCQHLGRRVFRHVVRVSDRPSGQTGRGRRQSLAPDRGTCPAGWRGLSVQRPHDYFPAFYPRQLFLFVPGKFPEGHLQQPRLHPDVRELHRAANQSQFRGLRAGRMEGESEPDIERRSSLRPSIPEDNQHRHEQHIAARRILVVAIRFATYGDSRRLRALLRPSAAAGAGKCASVEREHDGSDRCDTDQRVAYLQARPALRSSRASWSALPAGVLVNFTTMNRDMQNAYSEQGNLEVEQALGRSSTLSVSYQHLREQAFSHLNQSERAIVHAIGQ